MTVKKAHSLQRVLECAAAVFSDRGFEDVSLAEISELAHCSTTTIYDVYGSKENLFVAAITHTLSHFAPPGVKSSVHPSELEKLFEYTEARIDWLASPEPRRICTSLISPFSEIRHLVRQDFDGKYASICGIVAAMATKCIDQGLLRTFDLDVICHGVLSGTIYEPFVFPLLHGEEVHVKSSDILRKVFTPLVTQAGAKVLQNYLQKMAKREGVNLTTTRVPGCEN